MGDPAKGQYIRSIQLSVIIDCLNILLPFFVFFSLFLHSKLPVRDGQESNLERL